MGKLYPPHIEGTLPSFYKNSEKGVVLTIPFSMNRAVSASEVYGYSLRVKDVINGEELTIWQSLSNSYELYASLVGGLIILVLGTMNIEIAIAIECMANLFMGLTDLKARKLLMQKE